MNSLIFLGERDFSVQQGKKGSILCNNLSGVSLVLFFSKQCAHCGAVFPIFKELSQTVGGCQFALLNISTHFNVAKMSRSTISPITHVPFIVLYVNGRPFMKYNGPKTYTDISSFVKEVLSRIQSKKNFSSTTKIDHEDDIPEYAVGIPFNMVCEGEQCYLTFNEAYSKGSGMIGANGNDGASSSSNQRSMMMAQEPRGYVDPRTARERMNSHNDSGGYGH